MPLTSIYGKVYNNAKYIRNSLISLIHVLPDFDDYYELVVVDNYSTDGTFKILKNFAREHKNIKVIRAKCSRGKGRDVALKNSSGDYVFYIDFDDIFEEQLGIVINRLKQICIDGELWLFHGFSTKKTSVEMIGGWKDLNYGEDWEFCARAIARGINVKLICIPPFSLAENVRIREARYAGGYLSYQVRKFKNIIDTIRGCNLNCNFFKDEIVLRKFLKLSSLLALALFPISKTLAFKHDKKFSNIELVYKNEHLIFPEDVGLPRNWFIIMWEHVQQTWFIVKERIKELIKRDKKLKFLFFKEKNLLFCTRNPHLTKKYFDHIIH